MSGTHNYLRRLEEFDTGYIEGKTDMTSQRAMYVRNMCDMIAEQGLGGLPNLQTLLRDTRNKR